VIFLVWHIASEVSNMATQTPLLKKYIQLQTRPQSVQSKKNRSILDLTLFNKSALWKPTKHGYDSRRFCEYL